MKTTAYLLIVVSLAVSAQAQHSRGYYRSPAIHGDSIVFTSEGDLWSVQSQGGVARRLTSHPAQEFLASFSPDGRTIAFTAHYEGPADIYTMPAAGGLPVRRTFTGDASMVGWTSDGKILFQTRRFSTLPDGQLATVDATNRIESIPLSQAAQGTYDKSGNLYFTRLTFQGSQAKRYQGGTAQKIWKYAEGAPEAVPLTAGYAGTSKEAMWWNGRVYFLTDRDGTMNLWSMNEAGGDLKQHTRHQGWDIKTASIGTGRIVYQHGADLRLYDIASNTDKAVPIELSSDFDNLREHWIKAPADYLTNAHIAPDGSKVSLVSRGRAFVAPVKAGRFVEVPAAKPGRIRDARFSGGADSLLLLSTESGEVELWKAPANGVGAMTQLTRDGTVLRWEGIPSPDGKYIAHQNKDNELWLLETATGNNRKIAESGYDNYGAQFDEVRWSPDSQWLLFDNTGANGLAQVRLYNIASGTNTAITTDRYDNHGASWSADGKWIYFLSDRSLRSVTSSPWGSRQPDPYFDKPFKLYALALKAGQRSPFEPADEFHPDKKDEKKAEEKKPEDKDKKDAKPEEKSDGKVKVEIELTGITSRLYEVPVPAGNYSELSAAGERLCWRDRNDGKANLQCLDVNNKPDNKPDTLMEDVRGFEVSADGKKMLISKGKDLFVVDAAAKGAALKDPKALGDSQVDLKNWTFSVLPVNEFRESFYDAWRLHRDYFYDRKMHGVDWKAMRDKYGELLDRVRDRDELNDLLASMVSELSALHTFVFGGDVRKGTDQVDIATLGARLDRDDAAGGYRVAHIYRSDPDRPDRAAPLSRPGVDMAEGDVITQINGRDVLSAGDAAELLRNQAGRQTLIHVKPQGKPDARDVIVKPISSDQERGLRYHEWEFTRRLKVDELSAGKIGYVHLRAMGQNDINQWVEEYTPVFTRQGLIIDVRHNNGGNIDSWILGKLLRKAWMYWQPRVGIPTWNMQNAFRGHLVVLCDEWTASDGEAFAEGFKRLGLGKVIGTRTWGGEIWLSGSNVLADNGVATAAETGVYGPERKWLIEGHGVEPDIEVDNLPHATFEGKDAQLEAAIRHLQQLIKDKPVPDVPVPDYPDKTWKSKPASTR